MYSATYSPEDNKLRLYATSRLDEETYKRVRAAGFIWAPKQDLFVAPAWAPVREDLLLELAGEIGDEDTSLVERAEQRSERFEDYSQARAADAESAHKAVHAISDHIPFGQPILVGHHSEKHARKDAERIENGMRRAVKMWETSKYWTDRAHGAIAAAKYKELPAVRARRIKGLEADLRKWTRDRKHQEDRIALWSKPMTEEQARYFAGNTQTLSMDTYEEVARRVTAGAESWIRHCDRWINHLNNRLGYERAMYAESGGTAADKTKPEKGGACRCWASPRGGWSFIQKVNKVSVTVLDNWGNGGPNFTRTIPFDKLAGVMTAAQVQEARDTGRLVEPEGRKAGGIGFFLRETNTAPTETKQPVSETPKPPDQKFEAMRETLKAGVEVVTAPQLFPTPPELAERMVGLAEIEPEHRVLEPSAGTGNILRAIIGCGAVCDKVAVEINSALAARLQTLTPDHVVCADFLETITDPPTQGSVPTGTRVLGKFDRIVMNPPFADAQDILHIRHALGMLKPGGKLVAICAGGPRQEKELKPLAATWEPLPADTFKDSGTSVNAVLLTISQPAA